MKRGKYVQDILAGVAGLAPLGLCLYEGWLGAAHIAAAVVGGALLTFGVGLGMEVWCKDRADAKVSKL
ncbi:MAG TPA: hypothetical protein VK497_00360 [Candidatus Saccharimonadales bacterium]|nr:hypothetical protein [Candidatus Saccharimonadales bacterium]